MTTKKTKKIKIDDSCPVDTVSDKTENITKTPPLLLSPEEIQVINNLNAIITTEAFKLQLYKDSLSRCWKELQVKYKLPEEFDFDPVSGEIILKP